MNHNTITNDSLNTINPNGKVKPTVKKKKKLSVYYAVVYVFLGIFSCICVFPLLYVLLLSFSTEADWMNATLLVIPRHFHFENYKANLLVGSIPQAFLNSIFLVVVGTIFQMTLTSIAGYCFTRKDTPGLKFIFIMFLIPMFVGGGLLPFYVVVRSTTGLNNLWALIIPFGFNGFYMLLLRNYFSAVPESIIESCRMDGAGDFRIFIQFILPLSKAGLATIALFFMVGTWNEWYWASMFIEKMELYPLALLVRQSLNPGEASADRWKGTYDSTKTYGEGLNAAMTVLALAPIMMIYPILQKYFTQGVMVGSVKG